MTQDHSQRREVWRPIIDAQYRRRRRIFDYCDRVLCYPHTHNKQDDEEVSISTLPRAIFENEKKVLYPSGYLYVRMFLYIYLLSLIIC